MITAVITDSMLEEIDVDCSDVVLCNDIDNMTPLLLFL